MSEEELLSKGVDSILLENPNYVKWDSCLEDIEQFDASLFEFSTLKLLIPALIFPKARSLLTQNYQIGLKMGILAVQE